MPVRRIITAGDCSRFIASTSTVSFKINSWNLIEHHVKERKFVYVLGSRSFSSEHRSEKTVATEPGRKAKFYLFYECLVLPESTSQVSQAEYLNAKKLWDPFKKKIKGKDHQKIILALTAKQIPVCKSHHHLIHSGKYDGPSLRKMKGYTLSDLD